MSNVSSKDISTRLLAMALNDNMEKAEIPEIYELILLTRQLETPYIEGPLSRWPAVFLLEWQTALKAEKDTLALLSGGGAPSQSGAGNA